MKFLTIIFITIVVQSFTLRVNSVILTKQKNGYLKPKLLVGDERDYKEAFVVNRKVPFDRPVKFTLPTKQRDMADIKKTVMDHPIFTYIDTKLIKSDQEVYNFQFLELDKRKTPNRQEVYLLNMADSDKHVSHLDERGYWLPQGKYVDIPAHPTGDQPQYLFTPAFSGCSLVVDCMEDNKLRVYHVQGGRENVEYNNLAEHGRGMVTSIQYPSYAFHRDMESNEQVKNILAFMFIHYMPEAKEWKIFSQSQLCANPTIQKVTDFMTTEIYLPQKMGVPQFILKSFSDQPPMKVEEIESEPEDDLNAKLDELFC